MSSFLCLSGSACFCTVLIPGTAGDTNTHTHTPMVSSYPITPVRNVEENLVVSALVPVLFLTLIGAFQELFHHEWIRMLLTAPPALVPPGWTVGIQQV